FLSIPWAPLRSNTRRMRNTRTLFLILITIGSAMTRAAEPVPADTPKPSPAELIKNMRVFCAGLNSLACEIDYVRVLKSARLDSERRAHFDAAFQRPNLVSILMKDDDRVTYAWISDGASVSTYMA